MGHLGRVELHCDCSWRSRSQACWLRVTVLTTDLVGQQTRYMFVRKDCYPLGIKGLDRLRSRMRRKMILVNAGRADEKQ